MADLASRAIAEEQMDAADLAPETYDAVLGDLAKVNRLTMTARPTIAFLKRALGKTKRFSLLDVGFGEGAMLRAISDWAEKYGIEASLTGVDLNEKSVAAAQDRTPNTVDITYLAGDYRSCGQFDFIISSLVAHHMSRAQLIGFLEHMEANTRRGWFINDLHRHRFAHWGYPILARLMGWHKIVREDGQLSIARSYRPAEWHPILKEAGIAENAPRVFRAFPYKLCVERLH